MLGKCVRVEVRRAFIHYAFTHSAPSAAITAGAKIPFRIQIAKRLARRERTIRFRCKLKTFVGVASRRLVNVELTKLFMIGVQAKLDFWGPGGR